MERRGDCEGLHHSLQSALSRELIYCPTSIARTKLWLKFTIWSFLLLNFVMEVSWAGPTLGAATSACVEGGRSCDLLSCSIRWRGAEGGGWRERESRKRTSVTFTCIVTCNEDHLHAAVRRAPDAPNSHGLAGKLAPDRAPLWLQWPASYIVSPACSLWKLSWYGKWVLAPALLFLREPLIYVICKM